MPVPALGKRLKKKTSATSQGYTLQANGMRAAGETTVHANLELTGPGIEGKLTMKGRRDIFAPALPGNIQDAVVRKTQRRPSDDFYLLLKELQGKLLNSIWE